MNRTIVKSAVSMVTALLLVFTASAGAAAGQAAGGVATAAAQDLLQPEGIAAGAGGTVLIADTGNALIRRVTGSGVGSVAGKTVSRDAYGRAEGAHRDGAASSARFSAPTRLVSDGKGRIYLSDTENHCIRVIEGGQVSTLCGAQTPGYENGVGQAARFHSPTGLALDAEGNLYVADTGNHVIRKVDRNGGVTLFAGYPTVSGYADNLARFSYFNEPVGIAAGPDGSVYVADSGNQRIRKIRDGMVTTLAGGGLIRLPDSPYYEGGMEDGMGDRARFFFPQGVCVGEDGTVYVADTMNHAIRAVTPEGAVTTIAGGSDAGYLDGDAGSALFNAPADLCYAGGRLYIADTQNNAVRVLPVDEKGKELI